MNAFDILGIPNNSNFQVSKRAWKALVKKYHPDRNPGHDEAIKDINLALGLIQAGRGNQQFEDDALKKRTSDHELRRAQNARTAGRRTATSSSSRRESFQDLYYQELRTLSGNVGRYSADKALAWEKEAQTHNFSSTQEAEDAILKYLNLRKEVIRHEKNFNPPMASNFKKEIEDGKISRSSSLFFRSDNLSNLVKSPTTDSLVSMTLADRRAVKHGVFCKADGSDELVRASLFAEAADVWQRGEAAREARQQAMGSPERRFRSARRDINDRSGARVAQRLLSEVHAADKARVSTLDRFRGENIQLKDHISRRESTIAAARDMQILRKGWKLFDENEIAGLSASQDHVSQCAQTRASAIAVEQQRKSRFGGLFKGRSNRATGLEDADRLTRLYNAPENKEFNLRVSTNKKFNGTTRAAAAAHSASLSGFEASKSDALQRSSERLESLIDGTQNGEYLAGRLLRTELNKLVDKFSKSMPSEKESLENVLSCFTSDIKDFTNSDELRQASSLMKDICDSQGPKYWKESIELTAINDGIQKVHSRERTRWAEDERLSDKSRHLGAQILSEGVGKDSPLREMHVSTLTTELQMKLDRLVDFELGRGPSPERREKFMGAREVLDDLAKESRPDEGLANLSRAMIEAGMISNESDMLSMAEKTLLLEENHGRAIRRSEVEAAKLSSRVGRGDTPEKLLLQQNKSLLAEMVKQGIIENKGAIKGLEDSFGKSGWQARIKEGASLREKMMNSSVRPTEELFVAAKTAQIFEQSNDEKARAAERSQVSVRGGEER